MKMYLISDNVDTYTGMRLAGVDGVVVHEREELYQALQDALQDKIVLSVAAGMPVDVYEELRSRYGEELVNRATIYCALSDAIPDFEAKEPKFQEISSEIESAIDVSQNQEYALKVARYELREAFEVLIRNIQ